ncbi:MAG: CSLREA domain-containing protein [Pedobacter sp.]|nr:CSLREA domain-containing protein [Pedobacter sp.]
MSWPRGSLFTALLVLSIPLASADTITVNTTTDDYADNSLCSLREAVEYFNLDKPVAGFQGCKTDSTGSDTISVPANTKPYEITATTMSGTERDSLFIRRSVAITGGAMSGDEKTLIQVKGPHRAFIVSSGDRVANPITCGTAPACGRLAGGPELDSASDTGASSTDYLTPVATPTFKGHYTVPAGTCVTSASTPCSVQITLYDRPVVKGDSDVEPVSVGSAIVDSATGNWSVVTSTLAEGVHEITFTATVDNGEEGEHSAATYLGVYEADDPTLVVALSQMEIQGCGEAECAIDTATTPMQSNSANGLVYTYPLILATGKGGIIYNNETLDMTSVAIHGGVASAEGGAVYSDANGAVTLTSSKISENKAADGAAVYAKLNTVFISQSLVTENVPGSAGAVITVADDAGRPSSTARSLITNTTISGNLGVALSLRAGATINASTIVNNKILDSNGLVIGGGGLNFNGEKVSVYNTILAGNPDNFPAAATATDCLNLPTSTSDIFLFSVGMQGGGCGTPPGLTLLQNIAKEKLFASLDASGKCVGFQPTSSAQAAFKGMGLLCPLAVRSDDDVTAYHMPRLLGSYSDAAESKIVGKGADGSSTTVGCASSDQRGKERRSICDVGAVELQPVTGAVLSGNAITYGQTYSEALDSELGDEELFVPETASSCPAFALTSTTDRNNLIPGCPWITIAPTKGTVVFNLDGTYTYRPNSNFHGFDRFSFRVVTNLSKLNSTPDSQSRLVNAQIIMEPSHGLSAYSTSGSGDLWFLLALLSLGGVVARASQREQK